MAAPRGLSGMRGRGAPPPNFGRGRPQGMPEHMAYRDPAAMGIYTTLYQNS